ncbi:DUF1080 domain-containing protein [Antarcticibacterium sp. 1MA-6-2]|uniref:3-keto-disaccharide hydrolase n=1 Tax=Antarcticibacterium sp. 1MA-6-2 TaxID=2908210 RepID=UPI001F22514A|nr:DUF1080 domain-containing protein [Antarcticibacterium sp. 1MA-6-2]UJH90807.1 DUF1080 domain-containing protein [Antarcticibacterium sp. 1MA-6-2]
MRKMISGVFISCSFFLMSHDIKAQKTELPPEATEFYKPVPPVISSGKSTTTPPGDAIVLFDGTNLSSWEGEREGAEAKWIVEQGNMTVNPGTGGIKTKQGFGDIQLHLEWRSPSQIKGEGQGRGNSGVFIMGKYELQILDSYENNTYTNGQAGSIYKQSPPLVNATNPPGEWNTYDVIFTAPRFNDKGMLVTPARITVLHNGVLVQNNFELRGPTEYIGIPNYTAHEDKLPIHLQDHGNPVSFRNIWVREL